MTGTVLQHKPRTGGKRRYEVSPERLPSRPISLYIQQRANRLRDRSWRRIRQDEAVGEICSLVGINPRNEWAWRHGERNTLSFDEVDRILVTLGLHWWDIYTPERVRRPLVVVRVYRTRSKRASRGSTKVYVGRELAAEYWYGDAGPDPATLDIVRDAFEGAPRLSEEEPEESEGVRTCGNGHPLTPGNVRTRPDGRWACRTCTRNWAKAAYMRRLEAAAA